MNPLLAIIKKEIKEVLRDKNTLFGVILLPIILFPMLGLFVSSLIQPEVEEIQQIDVAVLNLDAGTIAKEILSNDTVRQALNQSGIRLIILNNLNIHTESDAVEYMKSNTSLRLLLIFPENFSFCIRNQIIAIIEAYYFIHENIPMQEDTQIISYVLEQIKSIISTYIIQNINPNANPVFIQNPISALPVTVYRGKEYKGVPPGMLAGVFSFQIMFAPMIILLLIMLIMNSTAMSVASEKEQKTLETLLTLPVKRTTLLLGKIIGAVIISILGLISYIVGFKFYIDSIMHSAYEEVFVAESITSLFTLSDIVFIIIVTFISLLTNALIGIIIGTFSEDTKSAGTITGVLFGPIFAISFLLPFAILRTPSMLTIIGVSLIPFVSPVIAIFMLLAREYLLFVIIIAIMIVEFIILLFTTAKIYTTEKILTLRIKLRRKRSEA